MAKSLYNSGVMQVTGTGTATSLRALMNTAVAGKGDLAYAQKCNYVILNPEATIRVTLDGQTPTAAIGLECVDLTQYHFDCTDLSKVMIIGVAAVNIQVGRTTI